MPNKSIKGRRLRVSKAEKRG